MADIENPVSGAKMQWSVVDEQNRNIIEQAIVPGTSSNTDRLVLDENQLTPGIFYRSY